MSKKINIVGGCATHSLVKDADVKNRQSGFECSQKFGVNIYFKKNEKSPL